MRLELEIHTIIIMTINSEFIFRSNNKSSINMIFKIRVNASINEARSISIVFNLSISMRLIRNISLNNKHFQA
jgi:hypothetical protein